MEIEGKNILVTGGLGELGSAIAGNLTEGGAIVHIFDQKVERAERFHQVDITNEEQVQKALDSIGNIDVLINCAGEIYSEPVLNMLRKEHHKKENWNRVLNNNLTSCFLMSTLVAKKMVQKRTKGVIINFSSIAAEGNPGQVAYSAAKAGVEAITKVLAKELGMFQIRTCAVSPGFIAVDSTYNALTESTLDYLVKKTPMRRLGTADDIAETVRYIIACDYLSGCVIPIDGALTI